MGERHQFEVFLGFEVELVVPLTPWLLSREEHVSLWAHFEEVVVHGVIVDPSRLVRVIHLCVAHLLLSILREKLALVQDLPLAALVLCGARGATCNRRLARRELLRMSRHL